MSLDESTGNLAAGRKLVKDMAAGNRPWTGSHEHVSTFSKDGDVLSTS